MTTKEKKVFSSTNFSLLANSVVDFPETVSFKKSLGKIFLRKLIENVNYNNDVKYRISHVWIFFIIEKLLAGMENHFAMSTTRKK